jgi:hypothetical protein
MALLHYDIAEIRIYKVISKRKLETLKLTCEVMLKRDFCRLSLRKTMSVCEDFLPKHFCGRFVPQTFARRIVEPMTDECEVSITEGERIKVSGKPASCAPIGVLNSAFLPR